MLAGTLPVSSGQIRYQGRDITRLPAYRRARIGLVRTFQLASEFKRLTVMENLLAAVPSGHRPGERTEDQPVPPEGAPDGQARLYRTGNRGDSMRGALAGPRYWRDDESAAIERATALLLRFGLEEHASGGQRRIVEIMRALMAGPRVLLLDEPMAGVHPNLAGRIGNELAALAADGLTVLMVEHELAIMDEFCDPVIAMAEGAVLAEGSMAELRSRAEVVEAYLVG
jgi:ABC-type branched-subunit amino acid transport system ATPase component